MWDELGIAPSNDPKAIRRAYAVRLKALDPDRDPGAFARLRTALEWALSRTAEGTGRRPPAPKPEPKPRDDVSRLTTPGRRNPAGGETVAPGFNRAILEDERASPLTPEDEVRDRAVLVALDAALRQRTAAEAIALYNRAAATGALSFEATSEMLRRLFGVAVDDATLDGPAFRGLTIALGWDRLDGQTDADPALARKVRERLAAEDWYDSLLASAVQPGGTIECYLARLLLRRCGRFFTDASSAKVRVVIAAYRLHERYLGGRIDNDWVARLERRLRRRDIFWLTLFCIILAWSLYIVGGEFLKMLAAYFAHAPLASWAAGALVIILLTLHLGSRLVRLFRLVLPPRTRLGLRKRWRGVLRQARRLGARVRGK
jgi:hypothetical protein